MPPFHNVTYIYYNAFAGVMSTEKLQLGYGGEQPFTNSPKRAKSCMVRCNYEQKSFGKNQIL